MQIDQAFSSPTSGGDRSFKILLNFSSIFLSRLINILSKNYIFRLDRKSLIVTINAHGKGGLTASLSYSVLKN